MIQRTYDIFYMNPTCIDTFGIPNTPLTQDPGAPKSVNINKLSTELGRGCMIKITDPEKVHRHGHCLWGIWQNSEAENGPCAARLPLSLPHHTTPSSHYLFSGI